MTDTTRDDSASPGREGGYEDWFGSSMRRDSIGNNPASLRDAVDEGGGEYSDSLFELEEEEDPGGYSVELEDLSSRDREDQQRLVETTSSARVTETLGPCPHANANLISRIFFGFITPLILRGYKKPIELEDLYEVPDRAQPEDLTRRFEESWARNGHRNGVMRMLMTLVGMFSVTQLLLPVFTALSFVALFTLQPFLLNWFISWLGNDWESKDIWIGLLYCFGLLAVATLSTFMEQHNMRYVVEIGFCMNAALSMAVFKKSLRLNNLSKGDVMTHMSVDARRIGDSSWKVGGMLSRPFIIVISAGICIYWIGLAAVIGILVSLVFFAPCQFYLSRKADEIQEAIMKLQDKRVKRVTEFLTGIQVVKLFAWEYQMKLRINEIRKEEMTKVQSFNFTLALFMFGILTCSSSMIVITFAMYAWFGNELQPSIVFPALNLFMWIGWLLFEIPHGVASAVESRESMSRIVEFLCKPDLDVPPNMQLSSSEAGNFVSAKTDVICVSDGTFRWKGADSDTLSDINFRVSKGSLVAVVGQVGSGKSSLLGGLLGECIKTEGNVEIKGSTAYVPQQAWIRNATIRKNITVASGSDLLDQKRYRKAVECTALKADLEMLAAGDLTEIGERGINISGGQRQRVNMARAVYADCDIYLLDDPLSAVDAHVGHLMFEDCILGELGGKTRVLVTHQLQFLPQVDLIYVMDKGRIAHVGTYEQLVQEGVDFQSLTVPDQDNSLQCSAEEPSSANETISRSLKMELSQSLRSSSYRSSLAGDELGTTEEEGKSVDEEERKSGSVSLAVYVNYIQAMGGFVLGAGLIIFSLLWTCSDLMIAVYLALWSNSYTPEDEYSEGGSSVELDGVEVDAEEQGRGLTLPFTPLQFALGYIVLGVANSAIVAIRQALFAIGSNHASQKVHEKLLWSILRAPVAFFSRTPTGRVVNRFSGDMGTVDTDLSDLISDCTLCALDVISRVITIAVICPVVLFVFPLILIFYGGLVQLFRATSRELNRLESISKSPLYALFDETLDGLETIRAYRLQDGMLGENVRKMLINLRVVMALAWTNRWLGVYSQFVGNAILFTSSLAVLFGTWFGYLDGSFGGLVLSMAGSLNGTLNWAVRSFTYTEANMSKLERIITYSELSSEAPLCIEETAPPEDWPSDGKIEITNVDLRYRDDLPLTLNHVTLNIVPGERVGVVGRTGAGKSSLLGTLFRLNEICGGKIVIDGVDISRLGLHQLRSRIAIIPQDPFLFNGTLRSNLDQTSSYSDHQLWTVLKDVNLADWVERQSLKLESVVEDNGKNLSVGQRQLVCLARALLKKTSILVMDEATASVDPATDNLIQATIRRTFARQTIITIAHRLPTVIDYDKICVLEQGKVMEFDTPHLLLQQPSSLFTQLVRDTGENTEAFLRDAAATAYAAARAKPINGTSSSSHTSSETQVVQVEVVGR